MSEINNIESKKRLMNFQIIAEQIKDNYKKSLIDKIVPVLFENEMKNKNEYFGRDEYFNSIVVKNNKNLKGKVKNVKILKSNHNTLFGEVAENFNQANYAA